ncbi:hypothetical protein HT031_003923 [Scenedesmus sp. PABB004]|nr:hypothetical protein HT031_003923 [Scenedesmus sp. PABB004]
MDALEALSDCDSDSDSGDASGSGSGAGGGAGAGDAAGASGGAAGPAAAGPGPAAKKAKITLADLEAQGYTSGPSVLFIKPPDEAAEASWEWGDGRAQKSGEGAEESAEERRRTHEAATTAAEEAAALAMKAQAHAARLREAARAEKEELAKKKRLTWNDKEKRKREAGMASRGRSTVEEEKRVARQYGVFSGFD